MFKLNTLPVRSYEKDFIVQMEISIEMNLNQVTLARTGYTTLDVLSDIGGIQGILLSAMSIFLSFWNYSNFENYMASRLYKIKNNNSVRGAEEYKISPPRLLNILEYFLDLIPAKCRCQKSR